MASEVADNEFARRFCPEPSDIRIGRMECETFAGVSNPQSQGHPSNVASPLPHEHINMLGRYSFSMPDAVAKGELRPLRNPEDPDS